MVATMPFLRDCWYAIAWSSELDDGILARRVANYPIALYRTSSGGLAALQDRCPHRFAPLSVGRKIGDTIACGYHGLTFDDGGRCTHNPFAKTIPPKAFVKSYAVEERHDLIWVWLGDRAEADPSTITDLSVLTSDQWRPASGYMHVNVHYELLIDNLMDLSHAEFLHPTNLGLKGLANGEFTVRHDGDAIAFVIATGETEPPPIFEAMQSANGKPVLFTVRGRWEAPGVVDLQSTTMFADQPDKQHVTFKGIHIVVPETDRSSHYFYSGLRNIRMDDEALQSAIEAGQALAFEQEDKPMVEAAQSRMDTSDLLALDPVLLPLDGAAVRVRRRMRRLIEREQRLMTAGSPTPGLTEPDRNAGAAS